MLGVGAVGVLGLVLQIAVFASVAAIAVRSGSVSRALFYGSVFSIYGYALVVAFFSLFSIPWSVTNLLLAAVAGCLLLVRPVRAAIAEGFPRLIRAARRGWGAVAIVTAVVLIHVAINAVKPELSIDGQLYHGPVLASILQSGSLWGWSVPNEYAFYTDLTMAGGVNLATFAGDARFDDALQVPHLVLLMLSINWALAGRFRSVFVRMALSALIVVAPVIWMQPRILYVDLSYGAAVAGATFMVVLLPRFGRLDVLVAGVLVGAVLATKPSGLLTGFILLVAFAVVILVRRPREFQLRAAIGSVAVGFAAPLAMASSFYVRNAVQWGNPIYPVQTRLGPITLPGILDLSIFASGERGSGYVDPGRWLSFAGSIGFGMVNGVTKPDYDPRTGGFGQVPLLVLAIAVALVVIQVVVRIRSRPPVESIRGAWKLQVGIVALAAAILLVQPSTFDSRYVIGPEVVILVAVLMTSFAVVPPLVDVIVGVLALLLAFGQVVWTERVMYPGAAVVLEILRTPVTSQPITPANPWGQGPQVAWLPDEPGECVSIALQTSGGVTAAGMKEQSLLGTLAYGLYGDQLCNRLFPIELPAEADSPASATIRDADYFVLYRSDVDEWTTYLFGRRDECLLPVQTLDGDQYYPRDVTVMRNACR